MNNKALLVIDMLNDFVCEEGSLYVGESVKKIIPLIQKKVAKYREENYPVIFVTDFHEEDDKEFEMFPKHAVKESRGAEIYKDLRPNKDEMIVRKKRFSAFFETNLEEILREQKVDTIELCGVCSNICILYTCADARMRDYNVIIDRRCVDTYDHAAHEFALKEMERILGAKMI